ncbi:MAG: ABC transporter substrate-binding protein, partial [Alphaproteobacteria bacterium]
MRRQLARLMLSTLLLCAGAGLAQAQVSDDVVKIGVLTDIAGPASTPTGQGSVTAAQMAIDDFGGTALGKPIQLISADHQLKPDIGAGIARRWYDTEQVDLILDVPVSSVGLAVQNVANEKHKLFITHSTGSTDFHGKFCSPYTMQWVFDTRALAVGTGREITKRGGKTWFFITDNYAFGHALEKDATQIIEASGGKVIGSVKPPFATPELSILITDVHALGLKAAQGLLLTTSFYWDMDDETRAWSKRYFEKLQRMPTMWQAGVYSATMHYLNAVKAAGTDAPEKVAEQMRKQPVNDFFSRNGRLR